MTTPPPLAFVYDRCVTSNPVMLDARLTCCTQRLIERGWDPAGQFIDRGDEALTSDARPAFERMLRAMTEAVGRKRVCLVYDLGRLSHDAEHRQQFVHAALGAGAWLATIDGESVGVGAVPDGRLTSVPAVIV
jgi:DNA invertase Pin-like site-specific DNA recombinase